MTTGQKLYYCECLWANHFRYSWVRMANRTLKSIVVPDVEDIPAWVEEAANKPFAGRDCALSPESTPAINIASWRPFMLSALFEIRKGKRLTKANMTTGNTPFLGSIDNNNGVVCRIGESPLHPGNTISVNYNGSVGEAFYQPIPFRCSDDVNVLYPKF